MITWEHNLILPYKNREIDLNKEVKVYRNLSKNGVLGFSVLQNGKVVGHTNQLMLRDCVFIVQEKTRQKILNTKSKTVHAFVQGKITHSGMGTHAGTKENLPIIVKYNPFLNDSFYYDNLKIRRNIKRSTVVKFKDFIVSAAEVY